MSDEQLDFFQPQKQPKAEKLKQVLMRCDCGWALWTSAPVLAMANHFHDGTHEDNMLAKAYPRSKPAPAEWRRK